MLPAAAAAALPLDDDNLLPEILLRLPPLPSSLPRASAVCTRWRSLISDPAFSRRFRIHHRRNAPLLGFIQPFDVGPSFEPTLEAPDRVPPGRLSLQSDLHHFRVLGCRHGLVLILDTTRFQLLVWDPVTGHQHRVSIPTGFAWFGTVICGAVLRATPGDVHFQIVLVRDDHEMEESRALACVYSSMTEAWGNLILTPIPFRTMVSIDVLGVLVGHSLYWMLYGTSSNILQFDLERESLALIPVPVNKSDFEGFILMRAEDGELSLLSLSGFTAQLWKRNISCNGVPSRGIVRTVELDKLLSLDSEEYVTTHGFAEDNNLVVLRVGIGTIFTVQIESLQFRKVTDNSKWYYYPFESFYAAVQIGLTNDINCSTGI
ncbi:putative F-box protein At3g19560 isoform X2 [Triticum aestivum]|uniref:putative F-box protein At3g19560 isoform X2 n=1 Tax=Triticum aestivum TaxID=4565 RepID=UPI001D001FB6|nr:putative F-box protein At3g19560 isoform X2 [Triticum aestivum]